MELLNDIKPSWLPILNEKIKQLDDCKVLQKNVNYLPKHEDIFNAFKHFELNETKLVFLGQDPYINGIEIDPIPIELFILSIITLYEKK